MRELRNHREIEHPEAEREGAPPDGARGTRAVFEFLAPQSGLSPWSCIGVGLVRPTDFASGPEGEILTPSAIAWYDSCWAHRESLI